MKHLRVAALVAAMSLVVSGARAADDFSGGLSDGNAPVAHLMVPVPQKGRTSLWIVSADPAGSPSTWCTFKSNILPAPGVAGSFEIVAGADGLDRQLPETIPQDAVRCAPLPGASTHLTIVVGQQ